MVSTRFGPLAGAPVFSGATSGAKATVVAPSEYVELHAPGAPPHDPEATEGLTGRITALDPVGHVIFATVQLDETLSVRLETHRERFEGRGLAPGAPVDLRWRPARASVVLDAA